jgi:hypothetical protein
LNASLEAVAKLFYAGKVVVVILVAFAKIWIDIRVTTFELVLFSVL